MFHQHVGFVSSSGFLVLLVLGPVCFTQSVSLDSWRPSRTKTMGVSVSDS